MKKIPERVKKCTHHPQLEGFIAEDGLVYAQVWNSLGDYGIEDAKRKYNYYRDKTESEIRDGLIGRNKPEAGDSAVGIIEEVIAYSKELNIPLFLYRGEHHWEVFHPTKGTFCYP